MKTNLGSRSDSAKVIIIGSDAMKRTECVIIVRIYRFGPITQVPFEQKPYLSIDVEAVRPHLF